MLTTDAYINTNLLHLLLVNKTYFQGTYSTIRWVLNSVKDW